ncbi:hypothetical protein QE431_002719 [Flavobacterium sp. SORGH_AS 622]|nr:hypothetical protein [Flavobacterium sp. SORGH_AS_0622]
MPFPEQASEIASACRKMNWEISNENGLKEPRK